MNRMQEISGQSGEVRDDRDILELLYKAQETIRLELLRQYNNGQNQHIISCLLNAQINIDRAVEALFDSQQTS